MSHSPSILASSTLATAALGLSLIAGQATADVTAAEVWGDWRAYLEGMGYSITATQTQEGDTLSVSDIVVQMTGPEIDAMSMSFGNMQFVEMGDGNVTIVMPTEMPITFEVDPAGAEPTVITKVNLTQTGHQMIVSGEPDAMRYSYNADTFGLALANLIVDGDPVPPGIARFAITGTTLRSNTVMTIAQNRSYTQDVKMDNVTYDVFFKDPASPEGMTLNSTQQSVAFRGNSALPSGDVAMSQDVSAMLAAGFKFDGTFEASGSESRIEVVSAIGPTKIKTGSASATMDVAMGTDGLRYSTQVEQLQVGAQIATIPFPLFAEMAKTGFTLQSPLTPGDVAQDFAIAFNMTEFTMSDIIWALFDPTGQLPRDAATAALDLSGKTKVLVDIFKPEAIEQAAASGETPAQVEALRINRLAIDAVGAKLGATGDLTFDNTDMTTLPGFPKPVGDINVDLSGADGLIEKLVAMGMLPPEQVMGARMMLGLFAVKGDGPDTLKSRIEFNEAGQILANGQRIK